MTSSITSQIPQGSIENIIRTARHLKDISQQLESMSPKEQIKYVNDACLLNIAKPLGELKTSMDLIHINTRIADQLTYMSNKVKGLFKERYNSNKIGQLEKNVLKVEKLQKCVERLQSIKKLNHGNKIAIQSVNEDLISAREQIASQSSIPSIDQNLPPDDIDSYENSNEPSEESEFSSEIDFDRLESIPQEMKMSADSEKPKTDTMNLKTASGLNNPPVAQQPDESISLEEQTEESDDSDDTESGGLNNDSRENEIRSPKEEKKTTGTHSPSILSLNSPKSIPEIIDINAPPLTTRRSKKLDFSDPALVNQRISTLIIQMQTSSILSPESKKEITKTILTLLNVVPAPLSPPMNSPSAISDAEEKNESPAIEPIPLPPPMSPPSAISDAEKKIGVIQELGNLLLLFQSPSPQDHKDRLLVLESKKFKLPIIGNSSVDVVDRIYFHLYFIHEKKSPDKLIKDLNYGRKAMMGIYPATHDERIQAIVRAIAEFALQQLGDAVYANRFGDANVVLNILERLKISSNDMPKEQYNLAHALFGKMYNKHVESRKNVPTLVDPSDRKFHKDFGRAAFNTSDGVLVVDKTSVIMNLYQELKKVWQIP